MAKKISRKKGEISNETNFKTDWETDGDVQLQKVIASSCRAGKKRLGHGGLEDWRIER